MAEDCLYVKKLTTSTIVTHSAICNFTSVSDKNLVLAKNNCLQIHKIENGDGKLSNLFDVPINGNIIFLATYRPLSTSKHYIFFVTEKYQYVSISFNAQSSKISTHFVNNINDFWGDPIGAKIQGDVESSKSLAALNFYKSKIKIIDIFPEERNNRAFDSLMDNNVIASIQFLHNRKTTLIAVLYNPTNFSKHKNDSYIKIYKVDIDNFELKFEGKEIKVPSTSSLLKSLCKPIEGILVISNSKISFLNNEGQFMANISFSPANILATCPLYENNSVLLSDDIGAIINVTFIKNNKRKIAKLNAKKIGFANIAHCLSKIGPRTFFIGSICDDSQIVRINDNLNIGKTVETLKTFSNVGPIKDIELIRKAKIENDHQKILFCTGHKTFGQIGILEKSLEMTKVSELNIRKCIDIFVFGPFVLLTFYEKTRIFKFSENSLQEIETPKWLNFDRTIKFEKIDDNLIQITENSINLIEFSPNLANLDSENLARVLITHKTQHKTTQSAIKHDKILILNDKNQILLLNLNRKNMTFSQIAFFSETEKQVSSFSIAYDLSIKTFFVVIGYFDSTQNCVQIQNFAHSKLVKIPINLKLVFPNFVVSADSHFDGGKLIIAFGLNDGNCVFGYMDYKFDFNILCKIKLGQFPVKISATKYLQRRVLLASSEETICFDVEKKDYFYISNSENLDKGYSHSYKNLINTKNYLFLKNDKLLIGEINFDDEPNKYSVFKRKFNDFAPMKISFCQKTKKICVAGTTAKRSKNEPILLLFNLVFCSRLKTKFKR
ncbi:hypothetical protein MHBO_000721 [Bonamia ostreae]|uniref:DNA damage-binding protein 1 n=1 Tax=Bonamia ostreae TaxID=126728 RepID=A0ABV2AH44_9EUKA